jgi:hypothetical protein
LGHPCTPTNPGNDRAEQKVHPDRDASFEHALALTFIQPIGPEFGGLFPLYSEACPMEAMKARFRKPASSTGAPDKR